MNLLIVGANGQLGCELKKWERLYKNGNFIYGDLPEIDITVFESLENFIVKL